MEIYEQIMKWLPYVGEVFMALSILATLLVRIIPGDKDDVAVSKAIAALDKALAWAPTIGVNPKTKKMREALKELQERK
jgi:hypothetical protein